MIFRLHSSKPPAPPPPQKVRKCDPAEVEVQEEDGPRIFSVSNHRGLLKPSQEQTKEPQGLAVRKLDDQNLEHDLRGGSQTKPVEEQKVPLAHRGETLLATFYGMLYANDGAEKEWKLEVDGFIPVCFVQVHGNANKPFRIIAVEKSKRVSILVQWNPVNMTQRTCRSVCIIGVSVLSGLSEKVSDLCTFYQY